VSFHEEIRYSEVVTRAAAQKRTLDRVLSIGLPVAAVVCIVGAVFGFRGRSMDGSAASGGVGNLISSFHSKL
jgi:hypothetical protein